MNDTPYTVELDRANFERLEIEVDRLQKIGMHEWNVDNLTDAFIYLAFKRQMNMDIRETELYARARRLKSDLSIAAEMA